MASKDNSIQDFYKVAFESESFSLVFGINNSSQVAQFKEANKGVVVDKKVTDELSQTLFLSIQSGLGLDVNSYNSDLASDIHISLQPAWFGFTNTGIDSLSLVLKIEKKGKDLSCPTFRKRIRDFVRNLNGLVSVSLNQEMLDEFAIQTAGENKIYDIRKLLIKSPNTEIAKRQK